MKLDFTGLKALGEKEDTQPAPDLFKQCWDMLESYYYIDYDSDADWEAIIALSERIYQTEKAKAGEKLTETKDEIISNAIVDTLEYIEKISKHRHDYTYTNTHTQ